MFWDQLWVLGLGGQERQGTFSNLASESFYKTWFALVLNWLKNYTIAWFALVWLQFVLQFDGEAIAWMCNDLQKIWQEISNTAKKKNCLETIKKIHTHTHTHTHIYI